MSLPTANKLSTATRLTTSQKVNQDTTKTIGFSTTVKVQERAVTRQGLSGMTGKDTKTERKIHDKYYYITLLKKKITDINNEIGNMRNEVEAINNDMTIYNNLNKTFEVLSKEVQNLEGELADYNLAGDKYRSSMRAEDIESVYHHIRMNNKKKREESDFLYIEKSKREEELQKVDYETNKILQFMEQKLMELDPEQKLEYDSLREENAIHINKIYDLRDELARLNADVLEGENLLKNNPNKREAHKAKDQINQLLRKKEELELQTNESGLSVEELKQRLVNKYKEETNEKAQIDKKVIEVKKIIDSYKKSFAEIEKEMKTANQNNENSKAHDSITQKDKEYSNFIDNFQEIKKSHLKDLINKEEIIVALLESASARIENKGSSSAQPTTQYKSVKMDIENKVDNIKKAANTLDEARAQYDALQVKMKRLDNLEETLKTEIKNFREKLERAQKDIMEKFDRIDHQKEYFKSEQKKMLDLLKFLEKNKENYSKLLTSVILKNRTKTTQLEDSESYKKLRELEKKMQENENFIFSLSQFIDSKANENNFSHLLKECLEIQQEINNELVKRISK